MRKLLLASVAALAATMGAAAYADAQTVDMDNSTDGQAFPTPGNVTVRLNGRFRFYAGVLDQGGARTSNFAPGVAAPAGAISNATTSQGSNRLSNYSFLNYARLYPGFDGVAANGLKYGASLEIRQDNAFGAGGGAAGSVSGQDRTRGALYFRREWGYVGTDKFGTLRLGSSDNPASLYLTGTFENYNDGNWNGDVFDMMPGADQLTWPFADVGNNYSTTKAVYLSPQFHGVDFGLSYEPSTAGIGGNNSGGCAPTPSPGNFTAPGVSVATLGCDALASTSTADITRRKNTGEALIRYRGTLGPIGVAATAAYTGSGRVLDSASPAAKLTRVRYEDISEGDFGLAVTYAGFLVGGNYEFGRYNVPAGGGPGGLVPKGQPNSSAYIAGVSYTVGPVIVGASYIDSISTGDVATATGIGLAAGSRRGGQRREQGASAGGTYSIAPGLSLFLSYLYAQRKQNGFNFLTNASGSTAGNKINSQVLALGTSFAW